MVGEAERSSNAGFGEGARRWRGPSKIGSMGYKITRFCKKSGIKCKATVSVDNA